MFMNTWVHMHIQVNLDVWLGAQQRHRGQIEVNLGCWSSGSLTVFPETLSLSRLRLTNQAKLVSKQHKKHTSVSSKHWDYWDY